MYPTISEYLEAIKAAEDNFEQLKNLRPVLDDDGSPVMTSGNFAVVFKMKDEKTGKLHAVKCFLREQEGRAEAYRQIADELEYVSSTFLTPIKYLDKELFVDSSNSEDSEFPVLLMDWVEGQTLDKYIREHIDDQYELSLLAYQFSRLAMWLMPQSFAHGDLKPDNILVKDDGTLVLVDYDGMYVPAMKGQKARELGSPDFRHPGRTEIDFDEHIDDFSLASILLSLKAISLQPSLLEEYGAQDRLLFSANDYRNISGSEALNALRPLMQDAELASLYSLFILAISQNNLSQVSFRLFNLSRPDRLQFEEENLSTEVTEEDLANAWTDEYGVKYSKDRKRLLKAPNDIIEYSIKEGTIVICDEAFTECVYMPNLKYPQLDKFDYYSKLKSVVIPDKIICIGAYAFAGCEHLQVIELPGNLRLIGNNAFENCAHLKGIKIPSKIISIKESTFSGCKELVNIELSDNLEEIGESAFSRCPQISSISLPDSIHSIGRSAFSGCSNLKSVIISSKVKELKERTFWFCRKLSYVTFRGLLSNVDKQTFKNCSSLTAMYIPIGTLQRFCQLLPDYKDILVEQDNENLSTEVTEEDLANAWTDEFGVKYSADKKRLLKAASDLENYSIKEGTKVICHHAFKGSKTLSSISIPYGIIVIGESAFWHQNQLKTVVIPDSVISIDKFAFLGCSGLESIKLSSNLKSIGDRAFYACAGLTNLTIPYRIDKIGESAFQGCTNLNRIMVDPNNKNYDSRNNCNAIIDSRNNTLILGCSSTIIPDTVTIIGDESFFLCKNLKTINIPDSVREIGYAAFPGCNKLQSITISQYVNEIGNAMLLGCKTLTRVDIVGQIKKIPYRTFYNCEALLHVSLPESVTEFGEEVFSGCSNLKSIFIPIGTKTKFEELLPDYKDKLVEQSNGWVVKSTRPFDPEETAAVKRAEVVASQYGNSVCFFMNGGGQSYIPLSKQSKLAVGDELNLKTAKILTLSKKGKNDITRIIE